MGQYHKFINRTKKEYLEPFSMRASERFPSIFESEELTRSLSWLVCTSTNPYWCDLKRKNARTTRIIGSWAGDLIELIDDTYDHELSYFVEQSFEDISYEVVATLFEINPNYLHESVVQLIEYPFLLEHLGMYMMLDVPPEGLEEQLCTVFPNGWEVEFDRLCKSMHRDPREKFKRAK